MVVNEGDGQEEAALTPDGQAGAPSYALTLSGDWTMERLGELALQIPDDAARAGARVVLDGSGIGRLDTAGGWVIERARRQAVAAGTQVELRHFSPMAASLLGVLAELAQSDLPPPPPAGAWTRRALVEIGKGAAILLDDGYAVLVMMGETVSALLAVLFGRRRMRWPALFSHINRTAIQAVPIIALMSFLIGMIIAQQGGFYLHTYGADVLVVDLVGVLTCREIGVLLTAIMVAGRSGSAFTAEIGSMKMREEIDAMRTLGLDPDMVLLVPRVLALVLMLPILGLVANVAGLVGGGLMSWVTLGISPSMFVARLVADTAPGHVVVGLSKAPVVAVIIGIIGVRAGMKVGKDAASLGAMTSSAVVEAIFAVIVLDALFSVFFAQVGI